MVWLNLSHLWYYNHFFSYQMSENNFSLVSICISLITSKVNFFSRVYMSFVVSNNFHNTVRFSAESKVERRRRERERLPGGAAAHAKPGGWGATLEGPLPAHRQKAAALQEPRW